MDFLEQRGFKVSKLKVKGHLEGRGNRMWSNEKAAVAGAADLKIFIHQDLLQFCSNSAADVKRYPL